MKKPANLFLLLFFLSTSLSAQRMEKFGNNGIAYSVIKTLYGIIPTKNIESHVVKDTVNYYVYLWIPDSVSEISVRLISPVPRFVSPNKGESITEDYLDPPATSYKKYFVPEFRLEKSINATAAEDVFSKSLLWKIIEKSRNSSDNFAQQSEIINGALLRVFNNAKKNIRLTAGLYRIQFSAQKEKNPEGTFLLQVGIPQMIPAMKLFRSAQELQ
ncbi:MAG: hypothetical protein JJE25_12515 [Bacteroidia bacterium]|nr:hypothetical protein [Bacteroidia bacterium]